MPLVYDYNVNCSALSRFDPLFRWREWVRVRVRMRSIKSHEFGGVQPSPQPSPRGRGRKKAVRCKKPADHGEVLQGFVSDLVLFDEGVKTAIVADVGVLDARHVLRRGTRLRGDRHHLIAGRIQKLRCFVDEPCNKPAAGDAVEGGSERMWAWAFMAQSFSCKGKLAFCHSSMPPFRKRALMPWARRRSAVERPTSWP